MVLEDFYKSTLDPFGVENDIEEQWKNKIIIELIKTHIGDRFYSVLDIGCGEGNLITGLKTLLYPENRLYGLDVSKTALERACNKHPELIPINQDLENEGSGFLGEFDLVTCSEFLYYIKPWFYKDVAKKISDFVSRNGYLVLSISQYFTEHDIINMFNNFKIISLETFPHSKYGYGFIFIGQKKGV